MKNGVLVKVLLAIILAVIAGSLTGSELELLGVPFVRLYGLVGQLFLNALTLVVIPLVVSSIITGTARMGNDQSFGSLGAKTFGCYVVTNLMAILVGLCFTLLMTPGISSSSLNILSLDSGKIADFAMQSQGNAFDKIEFILLKVVPPNIFAAAAQGQMLGLIFFSLLFGFFISKIESRSASVLLDFWKGIFQIMMAITQLVMKALPIGVFGLVAKVIATTGLEAISSVAMYTCTVLLALAFYAFIILPLLLIGVARVNPILHFRAMAPALFTAFSTSSSAASLPITIDCVEKRAGVSNRICSFTVPLGASLNLSGSALFQCVAVLFIAQAYSIDLPGTTLFVIVLMTLLSSFGMAGIPSAALISIVIILGTIGVPAEGIGLVLAVERILDMFRTAVNVLGNTCCAVLVARSEGETAVLSTTPLIIQKADP